MVCWETPSEPRQSGFHVFVREKVKIQKVKEKITKPRRIAEAA